MTAPNTHPSIDRSLCGEIVELSPGSAIVELTTDARMAADARGLVHGGFLFGAADYAAMLAVNDPNVVLGAASTLFRAPMTVGQKARVIANERAPEPGKSGRKREVEVTAEVDGKQVFTGTFTCFVLDTHVLDRK